MAVNNNCLGEFLYESLTKEMKQRVIPLLMFVMLKINGDLKSRGASNGSFQRVRTDKVDCTSPMPGFYALKHVAEVAEKE